VTDPRRPFYIIAHNPDSIGELKQVLDEGANALEPDVCFDGAAWDDFNVRDRWTFAPGFLSRAIYSDPPLRTYLRALVASLNARTPHNLALLAFDLKQPFHHDINIFFRIVEEEFSVYFPDVPVMASVGVPRGLRMLARRVHPGSNEALGIDEGISPKRADRIAKQFPTPFVFGIGTSVPLVPTTIYLPRIAKAIKYRDRGNSFRMVYPWTVNSEASMRRFLDLEGRIDGMITDHPALLRKLIESAPYNTLYRIATAEDSPFRR